MTADQRPSTANPESPGAIRNLVLMLGDQLDPHSATFDGFDPENDGVWMAENATEATHAWCHKQRLVRFFVAMRHVRDRQIEAGQRVVYHALDAATGAGTSRRFCTPRSANPHHSV